MKASTFVHSVDGGSSLTVESSVLLVFERRFQGGWKVKVEIFKSWAGSFLCA